MNVLAIGAHPDDVEYNCSGTLAKFASLGHTVFIATATNGNIGSATHTMEEIAAIRKAEAAHSASLIGAEYLCLDYDDEMFFDSKQARLDFINLIRYCRADLILTHYPEDYNPDHELTSKIVNDVAVMIPIAHLKTESPPYDAIPVIYYFEPAHGFRFIPTDYVDISAFIDVKKEMLSCHKSQFRWMADNYKSTETGGDQFVEIADVFSRYRGVQSGVRYAEGFVRALDAYRVTASRLLP